MENRLVSLRISEQDAIKIQFTLGECIKECSCEDFVKQTKGVLERFEKAMEAAGFVGAVGRKF